MANRGRDITVVPEMGKPMAESACVRCGHCVDVCPVGAIYVKEHKDEILYMAHSYDTDVVAQLSADVIPELGTLYKLEPNTITMKHVCAALHKIGIRMVVSDTHAKYLAAQQAAEIVEQSIGNGSVILTNSAAVMNFVERYFPDMKEHIRTYDSAQTAFGKLAPEFAGEKPLKTINITSVKEFSAEAKESHNVDYVLNARELYRIFVRTGGAPARREPVDFDRNWADKPIPYVELLGDKVWNMEREPERVNIQVQGKAYKCAVAHNLGQVRRLLEGEWRSYDIVRLMA